MSTFWGRFTAMLWLVLCITACGGLGSVMSRPLSFDRYDDQIRRAQKMFLPSVDWTLYFGQLWQESALNPDAVSPAGAKGLAQFMPGSWADVMRQMGTSGASPSDAKYAIQAGAFYDARLMRQWSSPRPEVDRHKLALASYNAGMGNILKSQKACGNPSAYDAIMVCLPAITGDNAKETLAYAPKIYRWGMEKQIGGFR